MSLREAIEALRESKWARAQWLDTTVKGLELEVLTNGGAGGPSVRAHYKGEIVGELNAQPMKYGDKKVFAVVDIEVDSAYRRKGFATKMYEAAAKLSCGAGRPLASDVTRFAGPRAFWAKQVEKGNATAVEVKGSQAFILTCPAPRSL
jgi:ribosomal protein S18 acetylase RimI-like enzyme